MGCTRSGAAAVPARGTAGDLGVETVTQADQSDELGVVLAVGERVELDGRRVVDGGAKMLDHAAHVSILSNIRLNVKPFVKNCLD